MKKTILFYFLVSVLLTGCSKDKVGCLDPRALNYRTDADTEGQCNFTKAIFYNASNKLGGIGVPLDSVRVVDLDFGGTAEEEVLATMSTFDHNPPSECQADPESFTWELSDGRKFYVIYYYFEDGDIIRQVGEWLEPNSTTPCIEKKLTL